MPAEGPSSTNPSTPLTDHAAATPTPNPAEDERDEFGLPIRTRPVRCSSVQPSSESLSKQRTSLSQPPHENPWEPLAQAEAASPPEKPRNSTSENVASGGAVQNGAAFQNHNRSSSRAVSSKAAAPSEWSHQSMLNQAPAEPDDEEEDLLAGDWQEMPSYAAYDLYDDDNKLIAREAPGYDDEVVQYGTLGGAGKGYTRVQLDDDAQSATSLDDNTAYLFKGGGTTTAAEDDDDDARDPLSQMQATKKLLTEGQRIAYVGIVRLATVQMIRAVNALERTKGSKKQVDTAAEAMRMWSQKMMVRLYGHMDIEPAEQIMIEQLGVHGVEPGDLTPALMKNARVKNPVAEETNSSRPSVSSPRSPSFPNSPAPGTPGESTLPPYEDHEGEDLPEVRTPSQLPNTKSIDIDLRWTVLCDLFLVLIADSVYDARSRQLLERVGTYMDIPWLDICRFEKRVTDALEMQEAASTENWNEDEHMEHRKKMQRNRRLVMMGLATVGGGLVIGLSAGLMAPVIGAGLAAGFSTIGVAGTSSFLAGAGGAAIITTGGVVSGGTIAVRASDRRTGAVKTFEYRPLHNNKRVNLIITVSGWMNGKIDDVRLPFSTVDPVMGDIYSVFWEPEMLQSMGDTINILATEALTQGLQQVLGSTILVALMGALQLPIVLTKLSYLIDNPWTVSLARAELAGLILADSLVDRNLGVRPVTLVGFSLGSRVIFSCIQELAKRGAHGLVQNVYLFGSPIVAKKDEYLKAVSVVPGRFVNGYATNDWILGYLFRATSGGIMRVAGLAAVDVPGVENYDVTELVAGHMAYRAAMPRLLREVGWVVESDEFSEIEDPDPENHAARQRELINEIEEARKAMEKKPEKKSRFSIFGSKKKQAEKKDWEVYDEKIKAGSGSGENGDNKAAVLFDVEAIRKEAEALSADTSNDKSTLPPMKLDPSPDLPSRSSSLRHTQSFDPSTMSKSGYDDAALLDPGFYRHDEGAISMTFDTTYTSPPSSSHNNDAASGLAGLAAPPSPAWTTASRSSDRPPLRSAVTMPVDFHAGERNAWGEEFDDDAGWGNEGGGMSMTFE
ncbi:uncharacterized protein K452DRAFT_294403 [Aplosporella prunicola CBS 121167]|uniref:DUF726-domain-containing protein n=1 Tax=Aplosporella prunicola CBS 121167 TaxID=1176127 RepID=A0A6A6BUC8_9PEZI|nr:uncharacterized protein K452DRAFT_294403 [Aplosporella prunicola CBS 121167]KAF2146875.1 hypothetical protein K452DRAFT_294403 [Aplosporella prunicola CBS 121167]